MQIETIGNAFNQAKQTQQLVRVACRDGRLYEGRVYRNGLTSTHIVFHIGPDSSKCREVSYSDVESVAMVGSVPPNLPQLYGDWNLWEQ